MLGECICRCLWKVCVYSEAFLFSETENPPNNHEKFDLSHFIEYLHSNEAGKGIEDKSVSSGEQLKVPK